MENSPEISCNSDCVETFFAPIGKVTMATLEVATALAPSLGKEGLASAGRILQRVIRGKFQEAFELEFAELRRKGRVNEEFFESDSFMQSSPIGRLKPLA